MARTDYNQRLKVLKAVPNRLTNDHSVVAQGSQANEPNFLERHGCYIPFEKGRSSIGDIVTRFAQIGARCMTRAALRVAKRSPPGGGRNSNSFSPDGRERVG